MFMNAYNIFAIDMILKHPCGKDVFGDCGPLKSIRDIGSLLDPVWTKPAGTIAGVEYTLDDIEVWMTCGVGV